MSIWLGITVELIVSVAMGGNAVDSADFKTDKHFDSSKAITKQK